MRRIAAHWLLNDGEVTPSPLITLDDEGRIAAIEQWQSLDNVAHTEFYAGALTAGFVNAHCHIELSYLRGRIERGSGFAGFARAIGQVRGEATPEQRIRALVAADRKMQSEGVVAVADIVNGSTSMAMKQQSAIRYHSFAEVFGLCSTAEPMRELLAYPHTTLTPHSTYSLQSGVFGEVASENTPTQGLRHSRFTLWSRPTNLRSIAGRVRWLSGTKGWDGSVISCTTLRPQSALRGRWRPTAR
jgi:hypothetical protein